METRRALGAATFFLGYLAAFSTHADFHFVQIDEVMAGANDNPEIQFIELTMFGPRENCQQTGVITDDPDNNDGFGCEPLMGPNDPPFSVTRLFFFDATGTPKGDLDQDGDPIGFPFPHNTPIAGAGRSILIGTQAFDDLPTPPTPKADFIMPAMVEPSSGKICYSLCTTCGGFDGVNQCLSYGAFSGDTEGFGSPAAALPVAGAVSLKRVNNTLDNPDNATNFALSVPAPCANTGACATSPPPPPLPVTCNGLPANIVGTGAADVLTGTPGRDVIHGLGGSDIVRGNGGNDIICGGSGNDRLFGGSGRDRLYGASGRDALNGGTGRDRCNGGSGVDTAAKCERNTRAP